MIMVFRQNRDHLKVFRDPKKVESHCSRYTNCKVLSKHKMDLLSSLGKSRTIAKWVELWLSIAEYVRLNSTAHSPYDGQRAGADLRYWNPWV